MKKLDETKIWQALYKVTAELRTLAPWNAFWDMDTVLLDLRPYLKEHPVLCSIMGHEGSCYGISSYIGLDACQSFDELATNDDMLPPELIMMEQTCLTLYWGNREEVPPAQKAMIKQLGLKFRGRGSWPYFMSYKRGYTPWPMDLKEANTLVTVLQNLFMSLLAHCSGELTVDFAADEHLIRFYDKKSKQWLNVSGTIDIPLREYLFPELDDQLLEKRLLKKKRVASEVLFDIAYLNIAIGDGSTRPINPQMLIAIDDKSGMLIQARPLDPGQNISEAAMDFVLDYIQNLGRMRAIHVRSLWVLTAISDFCEKAHIQVIHEPLPEIDEYLESLRDTL